MYCDRKSDCQGAVAVAFPSCAGTASLGDACAGQKADGSLYVLSCVAQDPMTPLVCAKTSDTAAQCTSVFAAIDQALTLARCASSSSSSSAASPPPATGMATPSAAASVCCGAGVLAAVTSRRSECCAWEVDANEQCCLSVDACGECNGAATTRDANGALQPSMICFCGMCECAVAHLRSPCVPVHMEAMQLQHPVTAQQSESVDTP
jgi:hypothetical protein